MFVVIYLNALSDNKPNYNIFNTVLNNITTYSVKSLSHNGSFVGSRKRLTYDHAFNYITHIVH